MLHIGLLTPTIQEDVIMPVSNLYLSSGCPTSWVVICNYMEKEYHMNNMNSVKMTLLSVSSRSSVDNTVLYCRDFQRQHCSFNQAHYGYLRGERKWLRHICSDCWVQSRKQEHHRAGSSECTFASASSEAKN